MQANPFQPDVNFRGYTASPLLGTPEGVSVYLDGVRQNQPFGDVVSWDLIPKNAISEIVELMPGSDPLFGLNTLGGALSVQTKDGVTSPGLQRTVDLWQQRPQGSPGRIWRRQRRPASTGFWPRTRSTNPDGASTRLRTSGRASSGWAGARDKTDLALVTMSYAYNTLIGNGLQDYRLLEAELFERLFHPRQHREPFSCFQFHRPPHLQRRVDVFRQRMVPEHPHRRDQRQYQHRCVGQPCLSAEHRRTGSPHRRGLYRISGQRRQCRQHAVSRNGAASPKRSQSDDPD